MRAPHSLPVPHDSTRLRIGLYHGSLPESGRKPGGVEIAVHRLANALAERSDAEVTVFSLSAVPTDAKYNHIRLRRLDRWTVGSRLLRTIFIPTALNFVKSDRDVLHLHGDDWFYFNRTCPTVRTLHGSALFEARTASSRKRRWSQYLIYGLERLSARLATVAAAVGPQTAALYCATQLLDNGVDTVAFRPGEKSPRPRVLFVGTWAGRKRGQFLHEIFSRVVRPALPDAELYMVCDRCTPAPGVVHVTTPDDARVAELFRSAWVFAYPSLYEGFGIIYLEAMASGTAIVTSPNPGADYVLRGGKLGVIVDDDGFGHALVRLLTDTAERADLATQGIAAAAAFSWDRVAEKHMIVYRHAIELAGQ